MAEGWDDLISEMLSLSQEETETAELAEAIRDDSDSESEAKLVACSPQTSDQWYVQLLKAHTKDIVPGGTQISGPIELLSGCTASFAEAAVLEALGIPFHACSTSEPNPSFRKFAHCNHAVDHAHEFLRGQADDAPCTLHPHARSCCVPCSVDLSIFGTPCPPFSQQRSKRMVSGTVKNHVLYSTTFGEATAFLERKEPKAAVMEQVRGFDKPEYAGDKSTPMRRFLDEIRLLERSGNFPVGGGYHIVINMLDYAEWVKLSRPRIFLAFLRKDVYDLVDAKNFIEIFEMIQRQQIAVGPLEISSLLLPTDDPLWKQHMQDHTKNSKTRTPQEPNDNAVWLRETAAWREKLGISPQFSPWTSCGFFEGIGLRKTHRVRDLLDCIVAEKTANLQKKTPAAIRAAMSGMYADTSQSHSRRTFTNKTGITNCLTTSSELYSFDRDAIVLPVEHLLLHGHHKSTVIPNGMSQADIKELAGEGMALPCLAVIIWSIFLTKQFP
ncbi:unnamed protein product [Polarella glacialis]|uniref:Uncharacterized protein n=1 Tax=Polarella glacialis TaxID=89957 RepID=A0A813HM18_POLGL|nr:unnamed protein product [Polarella glacialis]|mmetsp:Transcript_67181/g.121008  ORF Transcript_67181/g.121008 Transcript_67181/m.121008 type:complete len:497 (+) Transcript_67181:51-1541(+)